MEDNDGVRDGIVALLNGSPGFKCLGTFPTAKKALAQIPSIKPHVVLMDINLPDMNGIECVRRLKEHAPETQIIMFTVNNDTDSVFHALQNGATGYLTKGTPAADVLAAIKEVHEGGAPMSSQIARKVVQSFYKPQPETVSESAHLTDREKQILDLVCGGYQYKEIGAVLDITVNTVHTHIRNIYDKLQVRSRTEALLKWRKM